jgi:hypothetical protein
VLHGLIVNEGTQFTSKVHFMFTFRCNRGSLYLSKVVCLLTEQVWQQNCRRTCIIKDLNAFGRHLADIHRATVIANVKFIARKCWRTIEDTSFTRKLSFPEFISAQYIETPDNTIKAKNIQFPSAATGVATSLNRYRSSAT